MKKYIMHWNSYETVQLDTFQDAVRIAASMESELVGLGVDTVRARFIDRAFLNETKRQLPN